MDIPSRIKLIDSNFGKKFELNDGMIRDSTYASLDSDTEININSM